MLASWEESRGFAISGVPRKIAMWADSLVSPLPEERILVRGNAGDGSG